MTQVTRRNNPYAASFESAGSLSASLDKSQQMAYDPTFHLKANVVQRTPVENMITEYQGDTNGGDFDVHSDCSDDHHASLTGSPITTPDSGSQQCCPQHFDAATMTAFLAEMGCIVDCPCPAGSIITVYNGDISQHFNIPSEQVQITRGVIKYADHQSRYGAQTRFRFQLCHNYLQRKCTKLSECSYIHATVLPKPSEVHLNPFAPRRLAADRHGRSGDVTPSHFDDPSIADAYPTMQPGLTITVHPPQGNQTSNELTQVPSEMIIRTTGAEQTIAAYLEAGGAEPASFPPDQLPRHCTKFQYRRVCTSGSGCPFIHSKIPFPGTWIGIGGGSTPNPTAAVQQQQQQPQGIPSAAMFAAAQPYPGAFVQGPQGAAPGIAYATVPAAPAAPQMFFMPTPVPMDPHHQAATLVPTGLGQSWAPQPSFVHHPGAPTMMMAAPAPQPPQPQGLPYMFQPAPTAHGHHPMQYIVMMPPSAQ